MSFDALCSLIDRFGSGCLTVRTPEGLSSRPFLPVKDWERHQLTGVVDDQWLRDYGGHDILAQIMFSSEIGCGCLMVSGSVRRSTLPGDICAAWSALADSWFPDGPRQHGIVALIFTPASAELWDVRRNKPLQRWSEESTRRHQAQMNAK